MNNWHWLLLVLVIAVVLIAYRVHIRKSAAVESTDPNSFMPKLAAEAVHVAQERGKQLNYSPDSVKDVESILSGLHERRVQSQLSDSEVNISALRFGAYIGEVLRRKYGGHWSLDHEIAGPKSFPIHWGSGSDSFPVGWCGKRILNGDEDNVWFKFQVVTSERYLRPGSEVERDPSSKPAEGGR